MPYYLGLQDTVVFCLALVGKYTQPAWKLWQGKGQCTQRSAVLLCECESIPCQISSHSYTHLEGDALRSAWLLHILLHQCVILSFCLQCDSQVDSLS